MKTLNMRPNNTSGFLFTFCGLDGCGKTTMLTILEKELGDKYKIFKTKQPTNAVRESDIFRTYMDNPNHDAYTDDKLGVQIELNISGDFSDVSEVKDICLTNLSGYQIPARINLMDEVPKNGSGKIIRR